MKFLKEYFGMKIKAYTVLWALTVDAWEYELYAISILTILWTIFCTIVGLLLLPLDLICCVIARLIWPDTYRESLTYLDDEYFSEEETL